MAISIIEATKLSTFKKFRLIAGMSGLGNPIEKVGILDWEFFSREPGQFVSGEFVLTSLLFAKDNPDYIFEAVRDLVTDGASGLAIKNVYYDALPVDVVQFADDHSFPIFIFDNSAYFEDIITEVMDKIRFENNYALIETKVDILIKKKLDKSTVKDIAYEINSSFHDHFYAVYLRRKNYSDEGEIVRLLERIKRNKSLGIHCAVLKYRTGIMIISSSDKAYGELRKETVEARLQSLDIELSEFYIGVGESHLELGMLDIGISECLHAEMAAELSNQKMRMFREIGIYSVILPFKDDVWMKGYHKRIVEPIKQYDEKFGTELFATAMRFIENEGNIMDTAAALFIHKNTVRYRMDKIREVLCIEEGFYEQLSVAMKLNRIYDQ